MAVVGTCSNTPTRTELDAHLHPLRPAAIGQPSLPPPFPYVTQATSPVRTPPPLPAPPPSERRHSLPIHTFRTLSLAFPREFRGGETSRHFGLLIGAATSQLWRLAERAWRGGEGGIGRDEEKKAGKAGESPDVTRVAVELAGKRGLSS